MKIREDILGRTPFIGCKIVFNPSYRKGLVYDNCTGFTTGGLPIVFVESIGYNYMPKTGFVVVI